MAHHMKTTIDMADALFLEARRVAEKDGMTLRALIEEGVRLAIAHRQSRPPFKLRDASFGGEGLQTEFQGADWEAIRQAAYEGRGA